MNLFDRHDAWKLLLPVVAVGIIAVSPALLHGIPVGADFDNHLRFALRFSEAINSGDFRPGWLAASNLGYGDPSVRFYPPALYYYLAFLRFVVGSWYLAILTAFTSLSIICGIGVFYWAENFLPAKTAMWAGIFAMVMPFHLTEFYQASLLGEYAGSAVLPFVFAFVERICRHDRWRDVAGFSAAYSLLLLTHLPLAIIGSLSLLLYTSLIIRRAKLRMTLERLASGTVCAALASSFYWSTLIAELAWIHTDYIKPNSYYDYRVNFLFSPFAASGLNNWFANMIALATVGIILPAIILLASNQRHRLNRSLIAVALVMVFAFLMTTDISRPLWLLIPKLKDIQFPYRWLDIVSIAGAVLVAASLPYWVNKCRVHLQITDSLILIGFLVSSIFTVYEIVIDANYLSSSQLKDQIQTVSAKPNFKKYLPIWAHEIGEVNYFPQLIDTGGIRTIRIMSWEPKQRVFAVDAGMPTDIRIHTYYYPHWTAKVGDATLPTKPDQDGTLLVRLPSEAATVEMRFTEPKRFDLSICSSLLGWFLIVALGLPKLKSKSLSQKNTAEL